MVEPPRQLASEDATFSAIVRRGVDRAPMEMLADAAVPALLSHYAAEVIGRAIPVVGVPYWTDAASLAAGIPTVLFGPSGAGAHATEEWVDLDSVRQCVAIYLRVIDAFCG